MGRHYTPSRYYHALAASRQAAAFHAALLPWITLATAGKKRAPLNGSVATREPRSADETLSDCAWVLATARDWDGAWLAHHLAERGWPVDVELVRLCHEWSVKLMDRIMAEHRARSNPSTPSGPAPLVGA